MFTRTSLLFGFDDQFFAIRLEADLTPVRLCLCMGGMPGPCCFRQDKEAVIVAHGSEVISQRWFGENRDIVFVRDFLSFSYYIICHDPDLADGEYAAAIKMTIDDNIQIVPRDELQYIAIIVYEIKRLCIPAHKVCYLLTIRHRKDWAAQPNPVKRLIQ